MIDSNRVAQRIDGALAAIQSLQDQRETLLAIAGAITESLASGGALYTAGNGGSAAQALHLAEELIGRYRDDRPPYRAVCLNADPTALTCIANDYGYEAVFSRQCWAMLSPKDVFLGLSTSGNSANLVNAFNVAREVGAKSIGLLGKDGGACVALCDHALIIPGNDSAHTQEAHQVVIHIICEALEAHASK